MAFAFRRSSARAAEVDPLPVTVRPSDRRLQPALFHLFSDKAILLGGIDLTAGFALAAGPSMLLIADKV